MNDFTDIVSKVMEVSPDEGDYTEIGRAHV